MRCTCSGRGDPGELGAAGVEVELQAVPYRRAGQRLPGNARISGGPGGFEPIQFARSGPYPFWHQAQITDGQNYAQWDDRQASEYLETGRVLADYGEAPALLPQLPGALRNQMPALPLILSGVSLWRGRSGAGGAAWGRCSIPATGSTRLLLFGTWAGPQPEPGWNRRPLNRPRREGPAQAGPDRRAGQPVSRRWPSKPGKRSGRCPMGSSPLSMRRDRLTQCSSSTKVWSVIGGRT